GASCHSRPTSERAETAAAGLAGRTIGAAGGPTALVRRAQKPGTRESRPENPPKNKIAPGLRRNNRVQAAGSRPQVSARVVSIPGARSAEPTSVRRLCRTSNRQIDGGARNGCPDDG